MAFARLEGRKAIMCPELRANDFLTGSIVGNFQGEVSRDEWIKRVLPDEVASQSSGVWNGH
jgi:hypothetical protein